MPFGGLSLGFTAARAGFDALKGSGRKGGGKKGRTRRVEGGSGRSWEEAGIDVSENGSVGASDVVVSGSVGAGGRRRRRRRRLLTSQDKSDIAFLIGQLGKGQAGQAAISTLLSRRC